MASIGQQITVGTTATLLWQVMDGVTYAALGYTRAANPLVFIAGDVNAPLPITLFLVSGSTIYLGGSNVASSGANIGAAVTGIVALNFNVVGDDSMYGVVASSTQTLSLLTQRQ